MLLSAESQWELPESTSQADVTQTDSVKNEHTDEPPVAKKKKTAEHTDVKKVMYFSVMYNVK